MESPMSTSAPLVTIFGGSGFVGRYITRRLAQKGWRIRVAVRRPNEAHFVRPYGNVGQVEPVQANIRNEESVRAVMQGADYVVNCVGVMFPDSRQTFDAVQSEGAARIAGIAAEMGVKHMVHLSAIGADAESDSDYARSKAAGEAAVLAAFPNAAILRPSVVFGHEDEFFNRFAGMSRLSPVLPLVGASTRLQPVYVDDVAAAAVRALETGASGVYELGGPEAKTLRELVELMLGVIRRRRVILSLPGSMAALGATVLELVESATFGLLKNDTLTRDQLRLLAYDNVVSPDAKGFADLGITPTAMEALLESYLYSYRPQGQYTKMTESAKNLRVEG